MNDLTLVIPYYRNVGMLREQLRIWEDYPPGVRLVLVDDGSPEPALDVVRSHASAALRERIALYRVEVDIPWNRGGARNLGTMQARTDWIVHVDIDHILPPEAARALLEFSPDPRRWYRFRRFRHGRADETRRKDKIADAIEFGEIHPHIDGYLCTVDAYWKAGGYNEDFSGCLGGGSPFLALMAAENGPAELVPGDVHLQVYTRSAVKDASDWSLSRDRSEFTRRKARMKKPYRGTHPIRFAWNRQTLDTPA